MASELAVFHPIEPYTILLAWHQYNQLWALVLETGVIFIPFLGMLIRNISEPLVSQAGGSASVTSLKRLEVDFFTALVVIILAGQPTIPLNFSEVTISQVCAGSGQSKQTVYLKSNENPLGIKEDRILLDQNDKVIQSAKVPVWWMGVLTLSSGFTNAAIHGLPCEEDTRAVVFDASFGEISPNLRAELIDFIQSCYIPTKSFLRFNAPFHKDPKQWGQSQYNAIISDYAKILGSKSKAETYLDWPGSRAFLAMDNQFFYGRSVQRFDATGTPTQTTCRDWWLKGFGSSTVSPLYDRFKAEVYRSETGTDLEAFTIEALTKEYKGTQLEPLINKSPNNGELTDTLPKYFINATHQAIQQPLYEHHQDDSYQPASFKNTIRNTASAQIGKLGAWLQALVQYPMVTMIRSGFPIAIALLTLMAVVLLPFGLIFSSFSIKFLIVGAIGLFSIKFLAYIFYVAYWLDQNFIKALTFTGMISDPNNVSRSMLDLAVLSMYFVLPSLYLAMIGWAGFQAAGAMQDSYDKLSGRSSVLAEGGGYLASKAGQTVTGALGSVGSAAGELIGAGVAGVLNAGTRLVSDIAKRASGLFSRRKKESPGKKKPKADDPSKPKPS